MGSCGAMSAAVHAAYRHGSARGPVPPRGARMQQAPDIEAFVDALRLSRKAAARILDGQIADDAI